ncbi:MAG TPA: hypothetical protein VM029_11495 [Opitutaceae bacterium]|nr:hypothetical protein [Opitutaceae bacterium]
MLEPAQRNRALLLALAGALGGMLWLIVGAKLTDSLKVMDANLRAGAGLMTLATGGLLAGLIFALRQLSAARDAQWDLRGCLAVLLMLPLFFVTIAAIGMVAIGCYVVFTGERLSMYGG